MLSLLALCGLALAQDAPPSPAAVAAPEVAGAWATTTYNRPIANAQLLYSRTGDPFVQLHTGGTLGARHVHTNSQSGKADLVSTTQITAVMLYGMPYQSIGADLSAEASIGPRIGKMITLQHGPELSFDLFGVPGAPDYYLPPTAGVALRNTLTIQFIPEIAVIGVASPGWVFSSSRLPVEPYLGLFHQVELLAALDLNVASRHVALGYQVTYDTWGARPGVLVSLR